MGDLVLLHRTNGQERYWVPRAEEDYWINFWHAGGIPCARYRDYVQWGHQYWPPPPTDSAVNVMLHPLVLKRPRRTYK